MTYQEWRHRLARTNDPALIPITHIDRLLADGLAQFWATPDAAIVTQLRKWPGGAVTGEVIAAAGKKADILGPLQDAATEWCRENGATHILVSGRDGWRHELPGFRHYQTHLLREL